MITFSVEIVNETPFTLNNMFKGKIKYGVYFLFMIKNKAMRNF